MKKVAPKHYAQALLRISGDSDANNVLDNFLSLIQKNGQLSKLGEILNEYERIALEKKEGIAADLSIAVSANRGKNFRTGQANKNSRIEKFKITARDDKDLLGGFKLRVKDILIDASLKKKLLTLRKILISMPNDERIIQYLQEKNKRLCSKNGNRARRYRDRSG